jgi:hypothetical protein
LYFLPAETGSLIPLQKARTLASDGQNITALSWEGTSLSYYTPGSTSPNKVLSLPAPCQALAPIPEAAGFLLGGPAGLWAVSPDHRLKALDTTPTLSLLAHTSFILSQTSPTTLLARTAQPPHLPLTRTALPAPIQTWWVENPTSSAGTFRYRDTLYAFTYQSSCRLFDIDTIRPVSFLGKAASPYLAARWGTEYLGTLTLSSQGILAPLNLSRVQSFAVDFLGGHLYYVRSDTLWESNLHTGATQLRAAPLPAAKLKVIGIYSQGRAKITSR